jgi:glucose-6-phosphate isomerase
MSALSESAAWRKLHSHAEYMRGTHMLQLFDSDPQRGSRFTAEAVGLYLDYSKHRVTDETLSLLLQLAKQRDLANWIARLFAGEPVNNTEQRAAFHMALRAPADADLRIADEPVMPAVSAMRERFLDFAERVRDGRWRGASGEAITDVVNIGIGGSDLGPRVVCEALAAVADGPRTHFISNVDGAPLARLLQTLRPQNCLFVVTSKSFTTQETMTNAGAARRWLVAACGEAAVAQHFVAVSTHQREVQRFGIADANMFGFWDWVGGRYSLWSAVGLSIALAIGANRFRELLAGAWAMDQHFHTAPLQRNLPVILGLLTIWNTNFLGSRDQVMAPYAQSLTGFVAWLQQLEMESNGKSVDRSGATVDYTTTPVLWGDVGSNAQHAFFQMLHQGSELHPVDFILPIRADHALQDQQRMLIANCLAQSAALMCGKTADTVRSELSARGLSGETLEQAIPHRIFTGNRPSNTLLLPQLDAYHLGALLALYEHRTFVQSVIWNINAFDQWGVELGKQLATGILADMSGTPSTTPLDSSTSQLLARLNQAFEK